MNKYLAIGLVVIGLAISASASANERWDFNGFVTVGGGLVLDDGQTYYDVDDSFSLDVDSRLGLQVDVELTDKLSATAQGVARGRDDWEPELEWAYITYQPSSHWKVRAGRMRQPFYMLSDYLDVGYAYSWLRPPKEVYGRLPISWFEGIDLLYTNTIGGWDLQVQTYVARTDQVLDFAGQSADTDLEQTGIAVTGSNEWLTLRGSFHHSDTDIYVASLDPLFGAIQQLGNGLVQAGTQLGIPPLVDAANDVLGIPADMDISDKSASFIEAGFVIDTGENWFVRGEWTTVNYDRSIIPESTGYYATGGLRNRDFTYLLTFASDKTDPQSGFSDPLLAASAIIGPFDSVTAATLNGLAAVVDGATFPAQDIATWTIGMRWDFMDSMAFKAEYGYTDSGLATTGVVSFAVDLVF
jgi:hypothetical protein